MRSHPKQILYRQNNNNLAKEFTWKEAHSLKAKWSLDSSESIDSSENKLCNIRESKLFSEIVVKSWHGRMYLGGIANIGFLANS